PEHAGERRPDRLSGDHRADFADACVALPLLGGRAVELGLRDDAFVQQPLHALEVEARQIALCFRSRQLRLLLPRVEQRQYLAFPVSITIIRFAISTFRTTRSYRLSIHIQQHAAVDAVAVAIFAAEEIWRVVLRLHRDEAVIAAQTPASGVPVHPAADVAREE